MAVSPDLSPRTRATHLTRLGAERFDLLVVGGGISGAGIAAEAASRGLSVALVDRADFASGTSSKSSKLLHGGLRYLEQFHVHLVREALRERNSLLREAPHVASELPFLYAVESGRGFRLLEVQVGLSLYDALSLLGGGQRRWWHRRLDPAAAGREVPALEGADLEGALLYVDGLTDDARLVADVVKTAVRSGAVVANYCAVQGFVKDARGRAVAAVALDTLAGRTVQIHATRIVNAAGPWVDAVNLLDDPGCSRRLLPTKGVHVIVPAFTRGKALVLKSLPHADGRRRWLFVIPWGERAVIGTTDTAYSGKDRDDRYLDEETEVTPAEVDYLLGSVNATCPGSELRPADVISAFGGYRPLLAPAGKAFESDISREHEIFETPSGVLCVAGGKLTTYRAMARHAVDRAVRLLRQDGIRRPARASRAPVPLGGSEGGMSLASFTTGQIQNLTEPDAGWTRRLIATYGTAYADVRRLAADREDLAREIAGLSPEVARTRAEVVFAVRHEMAMSVADVMARRTRLQLLDTQLGLDAVEEVADLVSREMASALEWDEERRRRWADAELEAYQAQVDRMMAFRSAQSPARPS